MDNVSNGSGQGPWRGELDGGPSRAIFFRLEKKEPKKEEEEEEDSRQVYREVVDKLRASVPTGRVEGGCLVVAPVRFYQSRSVVGVVVGAAVLRRLLPW